MTKQCTIGKCDLKRKDRTKENGCIDTGVSRACVLFCGGCGHFKQAGD